MLGQELSLKGRKVGIIGFNARPIASSIKALGGTTYVSDYWGDSDLAACSDEWIAVLSPLPGSRQRGSLENPVHVSLSQNFLAAFSEIDLDHILIGSGFDDHSESLLDIQKQFGLTGNSVIQMSNARQKDRIKQILEETKLDIRMPLSRYCSSFDQVMTETAKIGFPCVVRPYTSGGGSGIRIFADSGKLEEYLSKREKFELIVQEYIGGRDISASVLATADQAKVLSIQGQLVGIPSAGRNCDFVYCGNYIPIALEASILTSITECSEILVNVLGLVGSNGLDFVLSNESEIVLLEVNPRIQGTLEMLERAGNTSVTRMHLDAVEGTFTDTIPSWQPTVKMILYARKDGVVPDLARYPSTVDRSPKGVVVNRGDPVCTIIATADSVRAGYSSACRTAMKIHRNL
ncbi:MAG: ATP-grasp domain-containing protein [Candidatus Thorarchaeota archaeon]